jgi:hypothetical protein
MNGPAVVGSTATNINIAEQQIVAGDFEALLDHLRAAGVAQEAIGELEHILPQEEPAVSRSKALSQKLVSWAGRAATSVAKEGGKAVIEVAKTTISSALLAYFGLQPGS